VNRLERTMRLFALLFTVAMAVCLVWALNAQVQPAEYTNYLQRTRDAIDSNRLVESEIVRATSGAAQDFDGIDVVAGWLREDVDRLSTTPSFFSPAASERVKRRLDQLDHAESFDDRSLFLRLFRTEEIKTELARLRSTQADFTAEAGNLVEALRKPKPDLSAQVDELMRDIASLSSSSDQHLANRIDAERNTIESYLDDAAYARWRESLLRVSNEAAYLEYAKPDLDRSVTVILRDQHVREALTATLDDLQGQYAAAQAAAARRWGIFVALLSATILSISGAVIATVTRQREAIQKEHDRAEALLLNILPASIAGELKAHPNDIIARSYADVSVLFADIVGFTPLASKLSPVELVQFLNRVFSAFDRLARSTGWRRSRRWETPTWSPAGFPSRAPTMPRRWRTWRWTCSRRSSASARKRARDSACASASTAGRSLPASSASRSSSTTCGATR